MKCARNFFFQYIWCCHRIEYYLINYLKIIKKKYSLLYYHWLLFPNSNRLFFNILNAVNTLNFLFLLYIYSFIYILGAIVTRIVNGFPARGFVEFSSVTFSSVFFFLSILHVILFRFFSLYVCKMSLFFFLNSFQKKIENLKIQKQFIIKVLELIFLHFDMAYSKQNENINSCDCWN